MTLLTPADLAPFAVIDEAKASLMIEDASALAVLVAPCLSGVLTAEQEATARAVLRGAILRWNETGAGGVVTQQSAGPMSQTVTSGVRKGMFWPSEIRQLQRVCATGSGRRAHMVDLDTSWESGS